MTPQAIATALLFLGTAVIRAAIFVPLALTPCFVTLPALSQEAPAPAPTNPDAPPAPNPWAFNLTVDGWVLPNDPGYASPIFTADHGWAHLEARYNNEDYRTGSMWLGYNFNTGKTVALHVTPMIGGVFGRTNGIAPGCEASLTYKKVALSISNYYVFNTGNSSENFYYTWPQFTYAPVSWFRTGIMAQRSHIVHTSVGIQRGFFVGFSHKQFLFTTYIFNLGWTAPTADLELSVSF